MADAPDSLPVIAAPPPEEAPRRPRGLRFSLLSLCVLVAVACFAAAYWGVTQRERAAVQRAAELAEIVKTQDEQIQKLRAELGHLTITDPNKVHVLQLPTRESYHWKWRIYLPEGKWKVYEAAAKIPPKGFENLPYGMSTIDAGEFTLEAVADRDPEGNPRFLVITPTGRTSISISPDDFERLKSGASWSSMGGGFQVQVRERSDVPIELVRLRANEAKVSDDGKSTSYASADEPSFGLLLWIEPDEPGH